MSPVLVYVFVRASQSHTNLIISILADIMCSMPIMEQRYVKQSEVTTRYFKNLE